MKKIFSLLLALIACAGTMFADGTKIGDLYYHLNYVNKTAEVTYQEQWSETNYSYLTAINIPASVDYNSVTYSVTSIGGDAFAECTGLTSITIPNSVTSIGYRAFYECTGLTSITIPNSVTSIGQGAFYECSGLTSITIPNSVTSIGSKAFEFCRALTSVTIPNSVTSIGDWTFDGCSGLTSIIIPNSVTSIGEGAFNGCSGLTSITIPNSVTSIGDWTFNGCSGLTSVTIPNSVTSIGDYAFKDCKKLEEIVIPANVTYIGKSAFENGNRLETIKLGSGVETIGERAFANCPYILSVYAYMEYPPVIETSVFVNCGDLSLVDLFVPENSITRYKKTNVWKEFNLQAIADEPEPITDYTVNYLDKDGGLISTQIVKLELPEPSVFAGFTFVKWIATSDNINDGINIQAIYEYNGDPSSAPEIYTNPANPAQKLIRNGKVYILTGDKTYTVTGQQLK